MADVYLSYANKDIVLARQIHDAIESQGFSVWWVQDIHPGMERQRTIGDEIEQASSIVVLLSKNSINSNAVTKEMQLAIDRGAILPVRLDDVEIPSILRRYQILDLQGWNSGFDDASIRKLVQGIEYRFEQSNVELAQKARRVKEEERQAQAFAERLFNKNLHGNLVIEAIELDSVGFYDEISWNLSSGINILLGRNGYGKSFLLRCLLALLLHDDDRALALYGQGQGTAYLLKNTEELKISFEEEYFIAEDSVGQVPVLAIPDTRFLNRAVTEIGPSSDSADGQPSSDLARHGLKHFLDELPFESVISTFLYGLCFDYFEANKSFDLPLFHLLRSIVRDLTDQTFDFDRVERSGRERFTLFVKTEGNEDNPLPIQKASQGTLSILVIVGLIYDYLKSLHPLKNEEIPDRQGIVFIDEVDAHLHPAWQQKIVSILRDSFPNVQFVITAHSPLVVAGCLEDEVSVLRKRDGRFGLFHFANDFIGWYPEEIYDRVFKVEEVDSTYSHFTALLPFRDEIEREVEELSSQDSLTAAENKKLDELEDQLHYMEKTQDRSRTFLDLDALRRRVAELEERLIAADGYREEVLLTRPRLAELREALSIETRLKNRRTRLFWIVALALTLIFGGALAFSFYQQRGLNLEIEKLLKQEISIDENQAVDQSLPLSEEEE